MVRSNGVGGTLGDETLPSPSPPPPEPTIESDKTQSTINTVALLYHVEQPLKATKHDQQ